MTWDRAASAWNFTSSEAGERLLRLEGCLLGAAIGDALGSAVEQAKDSAELTIAHLPHGQLLPSFGAPGRVSSHTQMLLFTLEGHLRGWVRGNVKGIGGGAFGCVNHALVRWWATQTKVHPDWPDWFPDGWLWQNEALHAKRNPSPAIRSSFKAQLPWPQPRPAPSSSSGSGGLVRALATGWEPAHGGGLYALAHELAGITHGGSSARECAGALAEIVAATARSGSVADGTAEAVRRLTQDHQHRVRDQVLRSAMGYATISDWAKFGELERLGTGRRADEALLIALTCAIGARDFTSGVQMAVSHRGDANTTGAIAGGLLGAAFGVHAILDSLQRAVELHDTIKDLARDYFALVTSPSYSVLERAWERYPGW